jgi:hypothetical protein
MTHTIIKPKHITDIAVPNNHNNEQQELRKCTKLAREDCYREDTILSLTGIMPLYLQDT